MKKIFIAGVALAALVGAAPATAQPGHQQHGSTYQQDDDDWNNGGDTYAATLDLTAAERAELQAVTQKRML